MIGTAVRETRSHTDEAFDGLSVAEPLAGTSAAETPTPAHDLVIFWPISPPADPIAVWPQQAALLNSDGRYLTTVQVEGPPVDGCWPLGEVDEPSALLTYLFGRGQHAVMLDLEAGQVTGWLATRWAGDHRDWWLEPDEEPAGE